MAIRFGSALDSVLARGVSNDGPLNQGGIGFVPVTSQRNAEPANVTRQDMAPVTRNEPDRNVTPVTANPVTKKVKQRNANVTGEGNARKIKARNTVTKEPSVTEKSNGTAPSGYTHGENVTTTVTQPVSNAERQKAYRARKAAAKPPESQ